MMHRNVSTTPGTDKVKVDHYWKLVSLRARPDRGLWADACR